ncbi:MAG: adenylate kinase, partial [Selenomonadaceae bacterium]|nr:adenylate kinase [Selenomonadaceae bacterium]
VCDDCGGELYQRADDTKETMENRLSVYEASTRPLIEYYEKAGIYTEVDGRQPIHQVTQELLQALNA